jgi:hypothetical protein
MSCADVPLPIGAGQALFFRLALPWQDILHQRIKQGNGQADAFLENVRVSAEVFVSHDHDAQFTASLSYCEG